MCACVAIHWDNEITPSTNLTNRSNTPRSCTSACRTVGQICQKCKETSNLMWLSWIWVIRIPNVFSKNLGIFNYLLYAEHKMYLRGVFFYKIRHAGPVCVPLKPANGPAPLQTLDRGYCSRHNASGRKWIWYSSDVWGERGAKSLFVVNRVVFTQLSGPMLFQ